MLTNIIIAVGAAFILIYTIIYYERRLRTLKATILDLKQNGTPPSPSRLKAVEAARAARTRQKEQKKKTLLKLLQKEKEVRFDKLSDKTGWSVATLSRYLSELQQESRIQKRSEGIHSFWKIKE